MYKALISEDQVNNILDAIVREGLAEEDATGLALTAAGREKCLVALRESFFRIMNGEADGTIYAPTGDVEDVFKEYVAMIICNPASPFNVLINYYAEKLGYIEFKDA